MLGQHIEVDARANGDEEQAQQQSLERFDVRFQLMPEFTVSQNDTSQEGPKSRGQIYQTHQGRNPDDQHQRRGGEYFTQARLHHITKQGPAQIMAANNHGTNGRHHNQPMSPSRETIHQAEVTLLGVGTCRGVHELRQCQQGDEGEHRNNSDVLKQQDGERTATAFGFDQSLFVEGLKNNRRGRQGKDQTDCNGCLPLQSQPCGHCHACSRRQHHLKPTQSDQAHTHGPERPGVEFHTHQEEHHDHTELGKMLNGIGFLPYQPRDRSNNHTGHEIPENRAQPQAFCQGHSDDCCHQVDKSLDKINCHQ